MKKYTRIYFDQTLRPLIFITYNQRGMGGSKAKDYIENLIALCRICHDKAHKEIIKKDRLSEIHLGHLKEFKGWTKFNV